jgi:hypothetical protein
LRLSDEILARIDQAIAGTNKARGTAYNRTSWIRHAIEEKLAKLQRGKNHARKVREAKGVIVHTTVRLEEPHAIATRPNEQPWN